MTVFKSRKVVSSLKRKGFVEEPRDHMTYTLCDENGKLTTIWTKVSHNGQDINKYLIKQMSNQTRLSKEDFEDLINCPLSKEMYYKKLRDKGLL